MATERRFDSAVGAVQRGVNRVGARMAALSFWQFVLLAIILLIAAGITESFWEKPAQRRVHIIDKRGDAGSKKKAPASAEIRIDQDGVLIRRKAAPETKGGLPAVPESDAAKPANAATAPGTSAGPEDKSATQPGAAPGTEEIRIGKDILVFRKGKSANGSDKADEHTDMQVQLPGDFQYDGEADTDITVRRSRPQLAGLAFLLILALFVMRMFARAQQRAEQKADAAVAVADRETLQRQIVEARLQLLQAQVEPHFLFNTLAAVEHLIETAPPRAAQMQRHLIEYLRAALPRMRQQSATLGQEVELCVSYLKIMRMRMEERLQFDLAVPAGLSSAAFPPMMIQSLVENAIQHGLEPKPEGGSVKLRAEVRDGKLCVTVEDTGMGFAAAAPAGIGLSNIRERLHQLFGNAGALTMEPNQPSGTRATISVPYAVA